MKCINILLLKALVLCMSLLLSVDSFAAAAAKEDLPINLDSEKLIIALSATPREGREIRRICYKINQFINKRGDLSNKKIDVLRSRHQMISLVKAYLNKAISGIKASNMSAESEEYVIELRNAFPVLNKVDSIMSSILSQKGLNPDGNSEDSTYDLLGGDDED